MQKVGKYLVWLSLFIGSVLTGHAQVESITPKEAYAFSAPVKSTIEHRIMNTVVWPGYGELRQDRKLEKIQSWVFGIERSSAIFDTGTTWRMSSAPAKIPAYTANNGVTYLSRWLEETQFPYRFFGKNGAGVVCAMIGGELGYSYFTPIIPRFIEQRWGRKDGIKGKVGRAAAFGTRIAGIGFGIYLTEEHVRWGSNNIAVRSWYLQNYRNYLAGLPPVGR